MAKEKITKEEKKQAKLDAKKEKALAKRDELATQISDIKKQIASESDEKAKKKLRKKRDELVAQREGIASSKDGMTIPMLKSKKNAINTVIAIIVILALLCTYVATGAVRKGLMSYFAVPQSTVTAFVMKDGDGNKHNIKVSTYNYYYAMQYNNIYQTKQQYEQYGIDLESINLNVDFDEKFSKQTTTNDDDETVTWAQFMEEEVVEQIKSTYLYYYEAVKANDGKEPEIKEEQQQEIDDALDNYKTTASSNGYALDGYLTAAMGKGVNEKVFRREAKIAYIAENYQNDMSDELQKKEYSKDEYENYKKENKKDLLSVDVKYFECETADDAKAFVKALNADGSNFAELASKYAKTDFDKEANKNAVETSYSNMTRKIFTNIGAAIAQPDEKKNEDDEETYSNLDWIYSKDRKAGNVKQVSTSVVYIVKPVYMSDVKPVTVRHILITPEDPENEDAAATEMSSKLWAEAEKKAKKILDEYNKGEKTADAFAELAKENSKDSNASDGGIYENVTPNQMVPSFNAWCFDSARKTGDTAIVKTKFGYHIMYFESKSDLTVWEYTAQQSLATDDGNKAVDELEDSYTIDKSWFGSRFFQNDLDF